jgi:alanine dehydrogenase
MKVGIFKTSRKKNEKRIPIYPEHIKLLSKEVLSHLIFESNYGSEFGYNDVELQTEFSLSFKSRNELFNCCDVLILPKPTEDDFKQMKDGQIHFDGHIAFNRKI